MIEGRTILSLSPFNPLHPYSGVTRRIFHLNRELARRNRLFLAIRDEGDTSPPFPCTVLLNSRHRLLVLLNLPFFLRLVRLIRRENVDLIFVNTFWLGLHGVLLKWLTGVDLILDEPNVEFIRFRRLGSLKWLVVRPVEALMCRMADRVFAVSAFDRELLLTHFGLPADKCLVVPNGFDPDRFRPDPSARKRVREALGLAGHLVLYFNGHMDYEPNRRAVRFIEERVAPVARAASRPVTILVIGGGAPPPGIRDPAIRYLGFVDRVEDYINACDICIVPLDSGSGTRLKILEALACSKTVVSTAIGAEGLDVSASNLHVTPSLHSFVDTLTRLLPETRDIVQTAAPPGFVARYSWEQVFRGAAAHEPEGE